MTDLKLSSPAKINLFLRILYKRSDGFHELASLFQAIDLMDTLHFSLSTQDHLTCSDPSLPTDSTNLVLKAADLFRRKTGLGFGLKVHLEKNIPHEAGLGGGSGNAATTLWALNELTGRQATYKDLISWSSEIGSDISFFFSQGTAYCTGRGEIVQTKQPVTLKTWIVKPEKGTSTPAVYSKLKVAALPARDPLVALDSFYSSAPHFFNDLEAPAFEVYPDLNEIKKKLLKAGFETVLLSGSGSSFFCIGNASLPPLPNCRCYEAASIQRPFDSWY